MISKTDTRAYILKIGELIRQVVHLAASLPVLALFRWASLACVTRVFTHSQVSSRLCGLIKTTQPGIVDFVET